MLELYNHFFSFCLSLSFSGVNNDFSLPKTELRFVLVLPDPRILLTFEDRKLPVLELIGDSGPADGNACFTGVVGGEEVWLVPLEAFSASVGARGVELSVTFGGLLMRGVCVDGMGAVSDLGASEIEIGICWGSLTGTIGMEILEVIGTGSAAAKLSVFLLGTKVTSAGSSGEETDSLCDVAGFPFGTSGETFFSDVARSSSLCDAAGILSARTSEATV